MAEQGRVMDAIERVLNEHAIECTGLGEVTCRGCRDEGWMTWGRFDAHLAAAIAAALLGDHDTVLLQRTPEGVQVQAVERVSGWWTGHVVNQMRLHATDRPLYAPVRDTENEGG